MILDILSVSCVKSLVTCHILRPVLYDYGTGSMCNKLVCGQHHLAFKVSGGTFVPHVIVQRAYYNPGFDACPTQFRATSWSQPNEPIHLLCTDLPQFGTFD